MAYITREDGERFVIPSYRDVLYKRKAKIKQDILDLSAQYGAYMTFQRRGIGQFEVAFSSEAGYLFGECIGYYFKRPADMIYCEAIPDTTEAYLVVIKNNSVFLDGIFPLENIAEELLVFTTQKNNFEIYIYGNVPIAEEPIEGKVSLEKTSVKSFTLLEKPVFPTLPVVKIYQLQLVDVVLRQHGIGVFPVKYVIAAGVVVGLAWMGYSYITLHKKTISQIQVLTPFQNPYAEFNNELTSPSPDSEIPRIIGGINNLLTLPGWTATDMNYKEGKMTINISSLGANTEGLFKWAQRYNVTVKLMPAGFSLIMPLASSPKRPVPKQIYVLDRVIASLVDRLAPVLPGNVLQISAYKDKGNYKETTLTINFTEVAPEVVIMVAEQLKGLPLVLTAMTIKMNHGLTGTINLKALGS